jgi:hypothetical protein
MAVKLESLRADERRANDGDWIDIPDLTDPATGEVAGFRVRGFSYGPFQKDNSIMRGRWARKYENRNEPVPPDVQSRDLAHLYAEHLLLDWRGFDAPYSRDLAEDMIASPGEFFAHVLWAIQQVSRTDAEFIEDAAKNSGRSSAGKHPAPATEAS